MKFVVSTEMLSGNIFNELPSDYFNFITWNCYSVIN